MRRGRIGDRGKTNWTKEKLEHLLLHYRDEPVPSLAARFECATNSVYNKMSQLGLRRKERPPEVLASEAAKNNIRECPENVVAALKKIAEDRSVPWPKVETSMSLALHGRSFGGDAKKPGTKSPVTSRTRWAADLGTFKSSMG